MKDGKWDDSVWRDYVVSQCENCFFLCFKFKHLGQPSFPNTKLRAEKRSGSMRAAITKAKEAEAARQAVLETVGSATSLGLRPGQ